MTAAWVNCRERLSTRSQSVFWEVSLGCPAHCPEVLGLSENEFRESLFALSSFQLFPSALRGAGGSWMQPKNLRILEISVSGVCCSYLK